MKKLLELGHKSKAICEYCRCITQTTLVYGDINIKYKNVTVKNVMVFRCDVCGNNISIPAQTTDDIIKQLSEFNVDT